MAAGPNPNVDHLAGHGPTDGQFSAWTKVLSNGSQIKFYAKYLQPGQKVQFMVQNQAGVYEQFAWKRVESEDLNSDGSYKSMQNHVYFIRTFDLEPGKNRVRILVDGEIYWGTKTYSIKDPEPNVSSAMMDVGQCKLQENSYWRNVAQPYPNGYTGNATAFPFNPTALPITGEINVAYVFVDWEDLTGTNEDRAYYEAQAKKFSDYYWMVSEHKLKMNMIISDKWFTIPESYEGFKTTSQDEAQNGDAPLKQKFYDAAAAASDAAIDYSDIDIVFFAIPTAKSVFSNGPHEFNFNWNGYFKSAEKTIYDIAVAGDFSLNLGKEGGDPWNYYAHETGHMLGIPHQANEDENKPFTEKYVVTPLGGWDVMSSQGASGTLNAWLRWLPGWLEDDQAICVDPAAVTDDYFELHPINEVAGETEILVIKQSDTKAIVIESRRFDSYFDIYTGNSKDGLLVYEVDATRSSAQGSQVLLSPRDITEYIKEQNTWPDWRELDAMFYEGDSLVVDDIRITNHRSGDSSDIVQVTRVD